MNQYKSQHHSTQDPDMLNVHWDVNTVCQYNCSYCYSRREYGERWGDIGSKRVADVVLDALSRSTLPFNLGLLGGEPTLHPHYYYILDRLHAEAKFNRVYVVTNGVRDLTSHPHYPKIAFLMSYHPSEIKDDLRAKFIRNAVYLRDAGYKLKVNVMLHHDRRYWEDIKSMFYELEGLGIRTHPHFLYGKSISNLFNYRKNFWEYFEFLKDWERELVYNRVDGGQDMYNDYELFRGNLTRFTGWDCYNNNYEVDVGGRVIKFCLSDTKADLAMNPDFFRDIRRTESMVCPHSSCNCDGLLKQLKVNREVTTSN